MRWIVVRFQAHDQHPVSHTDQIIIKTYFDENTSDTSDLLREGFDFAVPVEHAKVLTSSTSFELWHNISEAEYDAGSFNYFVWAEPYGSAAFLVDGAHSDSAVGRLSLRKNLEAPDSRAKGSSFTNSPDGVSDDDDVISFDAKLVNSVAQFIADEMNTNITDTRLEIVRYQNQEADYFIASDNGEVLDPRHNSGGYDNYTDIGLQSRSDADYGFGHLVHADPHPDHTLFQRLSQRAQEWFFEGGGEWDHKPRIYPIWGSKNRIGNRGLVYRYDLWSNVHYGFVGGWAGFTLQHLIDQASVAQIFDTGASEDDLEDQRMTTEGYNLYFSKHRVCFANPSDARVTYGDMMRILAQNPNWQVFS